MYEDYEKILIKYIDDPNQTHIDGYERNGGYQAWRKPLQEMTPEQVTEEDEKVRTSRTRRRRISHRTEMELCSKEYRQANLSLLQCR